MSLENLAFDFIERAPSIGSLPELEALFVECTAPFGVEFYLCGQLMLAGGEIKTVRFICSEDHPWFIHYEKNHLFLDDPAARVSRTVGHTYRWSWVREQMKLSKAEQHVYDEAAKFGLLDGLAFPLHGPFGALGGGSMAGPNLQITPTVEAALTLIMNTAHRRGLELSELMDYKLENPLSLRQRECLNWAQHGKSIRDIASILSLSAHTVKEHLDAAKSALGVNTRIEAIVKARNANYIGFSPLSDRTKSVSSSKR